MDKILKLVCGLLNYASFQISKFYIDPCPSEGPIKSLVCLSVSLSFYLSVLHFSIFLRNGLLFFSDFLHDGR